MSSAWTPMLVLLLLSVVSALGSSLHPNNYLDTKAVQFRTAEARLVTGINTEKHNISVPSYLDSGDQAVECNATAFSPTFCEARQSFSTASRQLAETVSQRLHELHLLRRLEANRKPLQPHRKAWAYALELEDKDEDEEEAAESFIETLDSVTEFVFQMPQELMEGERKGTYKIEIKFGDASREAMELLRNYTGSLRKLCDEVAAMKSGNSSSVSSAFDIIFDSVQQLRHRLDMLQSILNSCEHGGSPVFQTYYSPEHHLEAVNEVAAYLHLRANCSMLDNSTLQYEYSVPVWHKQSALHAFTARPVEFLLSGRRCRLLAGQDEIIFATNGTDLTDSLQRLSDEYYLLQRLAVQSTAADCLRAVVLSSDVDVAVAACAVTCHRRDTATTAQQLNETSFAVLNPGAEVNVYCDGVERRTLLPRIADGRHEVTLPCHCGVEGVVLPGVGCATSTERAEEHLVVDSSWTDAGFTPGRLFLTSGDEVQTPTLALHVVDEADGLVGSGAVVATALGVALCTCVAAFALFALHRRYDVFAKAGHGLGRLRTAWRGRLSNADTVELHGNENPGYRKE